MALSDMMPPRWIAAKEGGQGIRPDVPMRFLHARGDPEGEPGFRVLGGRTPRRDRAGAARVCRIWPRGRRRGRLVDGSGHRERRPRDAPTRAVANDSLLRAEALTRKVRERLDGQIRQPLKASDK